MSHIPDLIARCQRGELAAFTELFRRHEARVYRLSLAILNDDQDAEDAVQDSFVRILERIKSYRGDSSFETWLTRLVVNLCRDKIRRQKVRRALSLEWLRGQASEHNVAQEVDERWQKQTLWSLVYRLEEKYRLVVILRYHEELPCEEIAGVLEIPVSTVYARLNSARLQLKEMAEKVKEKSMELFVLNQV